MNRLIALTCIFQQEKDGLIRLNAISHYFKHLHSQDILWAISLFSGKMLFRKIPSARLLDEAKKIPDLPDWLMDECLSVVGDAIETLSLLLIPSETPHFTLKECITTIIAAVEAKGQDQLEILQDLWTKLSEPGIAIANQILTSRFPYIFSSHELGQAISKAFDLDPYFTTFQLSQKWSPFSDSVEDLFFRDISKERLVRPYPFFSPTIFLESSQVDYKVEWVASLWFPGPQIQLIKRGELVVIWNESGELMNGTFSSLVKSCKKMEVDFVVTGQIMMREIGQVLSPDKKRKERTVSPTPVFMANDLLEWNGENITPYSFQIRLRKLVDFMKSTSDRNPDWTLNDVVAIHNSGDLDQRLLLARELKCKGIYIRECSSGAYGESSVFLVPAGKFVFSGVLIYVQETIVQSVEKQLELSIAVAHEDSVLPFTKVRLGAREHPDLFQLIRHFVARNTVEKFGPVRKVHPLLVFEISFETIRLSNRHKSGIVLQNPKILRMEPDKLASDINRLEELKQLL